MFRKLKDTANSVLFLWLILRIILHPDKFISDLEKTGYVLKMQQDILQGKDVEEKEGV